MPSKNMLPKGQRRRSVRAEYRATRGAEAATAAEGHALDLDLEPDPDLEIEPDNDHDDKPPEAVRRFRADAAAAGMRLDAYLAQAIPSPSGPEAKLSRSRVQLLIEAGQVKLNGVAASRKQKLRGGEEIAIEGEPHPEPLHATPEDIPLDILYEDKYLAVVNKPAGMMVHAGAGRANLASDGEIAAGSGVDRGNSGTLVNALLHHMAQQSGTLSGVGGELRPGIVHRLDKQTSGAIVVAKDDATHRMLGEMFAQRRVAKTYLALVHGAIAQDRVAKDDITVNLPVARDLVRRTRMTTRRRDGRSAVSHIHVLERLATRYGAFTLAEVRIETGRTHQIRVHMQSLGTPVAGDTLYGAPRSIPPAARRQGNAHPNEEEALRLERNFLHAAHLEFVHPRTGKLVAIDAPLPAELEEFLARLRA